MKYGVAALAVLFASVATTTDAFVVRPVSTSTAAASVAQQPNRGPNSSSLAEGENQAKLYSSYYGSGYDSNRSGYGYDPNTQQTQQEIYAYQRSQSELQQEIDNLQRALNELNVQMDAERRERYQEAELSNERLRLLNDYQQQYGELERNLEDTTRQLYNTGGSYDSSYYGSGYGTSSNRNRNIAGRGYDNSYYNNYNSNYNWQGDRSNYDSFHIDDRFNNYDNTGYGSGYGRGSSNYYGNNRGYGGGYGSSYGYGGSQYNPGYRGGYNNNALEDHYDDPLGGNNRNGYDEYNRRAATGNGAMQYGYGSGNYRGGGYGRDLVARSSNYNRQGDQTYG